MNILNYSFTLESLLLKFGLGSQIKLRRLGRWDLKQIVHVRSQIVVYEIHSRKHFVKFKPTIGSGNINNAPYTWGAGDNNAIRDFNNK